MKVCSSCSIPKDATEYHTPSRTVCKECVALERQKKKQEYDANASNITKECSICKEQKQGTEFAWDSTQCRPCQNKKKNRVANRPTADMPNKVCSKCDVDKVATLFRHNTRVCIECEKQDMYEWRKKNPEKFKEHLQKYRSTESYKMKRNEHRKNLYHTDICERVKQNLRNRVRAAIKATSKTRVAVKSAKTEELLGCSYDVLVAWLEFNFEQDMTWDNMGTYWHIDHIIPCASFDLSCEDDQRRCFSWRNMAPMEASQNISKGTNIDKRLIKYYEYRVQEFKESNPNLEFTTLSATSSN